MLELPYQFPSICLTRIHKGSDELARIYYGESVKLLYQLKNLMTFRNLGQLKMTRCFPDGTIITAWSIFGSDFVTIDTALVSEEEEVGVSGVNSCIITFIDLPTQVPPMKNRGVILDTEMIGTDFIKTYYVIDVSDCPNCKTMETNFLFNYAIPYVSQHYNGDVDNHCIYSLAPPCWAEVIDKGRDTKGTFFRWKAYTETEILSRTGLGISLLKSTIQDADNIQICFAQNEVKVDCCLKPIKDRKALMWWGYCPGGGEGCHVPEEPTSYSIVLLFQYGIINFWVDPEKDGGCLPFEWKITGQGELTIPDGETDPWKLNAKYQLGTTLEMLDCNTQTVINVKDRCGEEDQFIFKPCCESDPAPLELYYSTLFMSCSGTQTLIAIGGCGPYHWETSSGTITPSDNTSTAQLRAPVSNGGCSNNPLVTLTDCCGESQQVQFYANCYTGNVPAYEVWSWNYISTDCKGFHQGGNEYQIYRTRYKCDMTLYDGPTLVNNICLCQDFAPGPGEAYCLFTLLSGTPCASGCIYSSPTPPNNQYPGDGEVVDVRSPAMIAAGCCPMI